MKISTGLDYDSIEKTWVEGFNYPIYEAKNFNAYRDVSLFSPNPRIDKHAYIAGKSFIIDIIGYSHFHFIYDKLAQYEFIKQYIPDLEPYIISNKKFIGEKDGLVDTIKSIYEIPETNVFDIDSGEKLFFESACFIWATHNDIFTGTFHREYFDPWKDTKDYDFYVKTIHPLLQKRFSPFIYPYTIPDNKLYISQFQRHEKFGRDQSATRYISKDDELMIEQFFKDKGYTIYTAENFDLAHQIRAYSSASHIASIKSSALVNTIFCKPETKIISISLDDEYQVWYDHICNSIGLDYTEVPQMLRDGSPTMSYYVNPNHKRTVFDGAKIISELSKLSTL